MTYKNREGRFGKPEQLEGGFSGPVKVDMSLKGSYLVKNSDGVGSKTLVAQRVGDHETVAFDLISMNADDAVSIGAEPFVGTNSLDVKQMNLQLVKELMKGLEKACSGADIAMVGGEIAELGEQVKGYEKPYIWNADILGVLERDKLIDGSEVLEGDGVVALRSNGIRPNGLTLAREICKDSFGERWHEEKFDSSSTWGDILLKPSRICAPALLDLLDRYSKERKVEITGISHVTGGGILNLQRTLPSGLGAELTNLFRPHPELLKLQELGPVSDGEAYRTWDMGQCFFLITPEPGKAISMLEGRDLKAKVAGEVVKGEGIEFESKGMNGGNIGGLK